MKKLKSIFIALLSIALFACDSNATTPSENTSTNESIGITKPSSDVVSESYENSPEDSYSELYSYDSSEILESETNFPNSEPYSDLSSEHLESDSSTPEVAISKEDLSAIFNNTFDLSNITILYANIPSATNKEMFINHEIFYENVDGSETYIYQKEGIKYKVSKTYSTDEYEKVEYLEDFEFNLKYLFADYNFIITNEILEYSFFDIANFGECSGYVFTNELETNIGVSINEETCLLENIYIFDEFNNIIEAFKIKLESKNISIEQIEKLTEKQEVHEHSQEEEYYANDSQHWKVCSTCYEKYDLEEHNLETIEAVEATCISEGSTEGLKCLTCEYYVIHPQTTPIVDHEFLEDSWEEVVKATYTSGGEEHQKCKNCDYYNVRYTNRLEIPVPEVFISDTGVASWPVVEGIDTYSIKTGANEPSFFQDTLLIKENSYELADMQYIQVAYVVEGRTGMYSEFQLFEYNYDSIDLLENIEYVVENSDGSYTLTVKVDDTTDIRLILENGVYTAAGYIEFNSETKLYSLDSLTTIVSYQIDLLSPSTGVEKYMYLKEGINVANKMSVSSKDELDYYQFNMMTTGQPFKSYKYTDYFEIYSSENYVVTNIIIEYTKDFKYECDGFEFLASGFPFLEGTRARTNTMQGILLKANRDIPNINPYETINIPIRKTNIKYFVDENGNQLPEDVVVKEGVKLQVEYQGIIENIDIEFIEKGNYSSYFESHPYQNTKAIGTVKSLVIPLVWNDQKDMKKDEILQSIKTSLGNVIEENGNIITYDYENPSKFTLSEYMNISSYGKLQVNSFVTGWYESEYNYDDIRDFAPEDVYVESIVNWAINTYNLNIKDFDYDNNGVIDSIIILHTGENHKYDSYVQASWAGAVRWTFHNQTIDENYDYIISANDPKFVNAITSSISFIYDEEENYSVENATSLTLIHEFAHNFGIVDYYSLNDENDVLGNYDMQTNNVGDWNAFSKYAVGWIEPTLINQDDFANGNTITYTLEEFVENGNVLLIPAKNYNYNGTPFDEYIMVELFAPKKLHEFDSVEYELNETVGVRIYHVNSSMRVVEHLEYNVGNHEYSGAKSNDYGSQIIELIQKGKVNEFQDNDYSNNRLSSEDFFYAGDSFDVSEYDDFFYNGMMDSGDEFGYIINIKSIYLDETTNTYKVEIEITLK